MRLFAFHDDTACAYYRLLLPLDRLAAEGWDIQTAHGWSEAARGYPVIVGQRIGRTDALPIWRRLVAGHTLVYEIDDDVWSIDETNLRAVRGHPPEVLDATEHAMTVSHLVTASTAPLAEACRRHNPNVAVIPNHIDARLLDVQRPRRDRLVVGWAGGDSHLKDIAVLAPHLRRFLRRHPDAEFHNIGTDYRGVFDLPGRWTGWQDIWPYYHSIDFDIGLAPLADLPFNRSKSHIRALELAALGIPVVASDCEAYRELVIDGVTGFLVRHDHEWLPRLRRLAADPGLRAEMGARAREVAEQWTIQRGWRRWAEVYERLAG